MHGFLKYFVVFCRNGVQLFKALNGFDSKQGCHVQNYETAAQLFKKAKSVAQGVEFLLF